MSLTIPPIATIPPTTTPILQQNNSAPSQPTTRKQQEFSFSKVSVGTWQDRPPLTSPKLKAVPAPQFIAQSELPGGSTPPIPPAPSIRDTGDGYPTRIPRNYFGPALEFTNRTTLFGLTSRFPIGETYSIRPSAVFGSGGAILRVPLTYDFTFGDKEPFERNPLIVVFAGGGVQYISGINNSNSSNFGLLGTIGVDVNLFEGVALIGSFNTDFGSNSGLNIGLGFEF
jgi:hypothetical protein